MNLPFLKYQGTGNDFVMIDNRTKIFPKKNTEKISQICNRHFGIGADGIILIEEDKEYDFKMIYFNADGSETFCGNGARCAVAFAKHLKMITDKTTFIAIDGSHFADDVLKDCRSSWACLKKNGILILDDFFWKNYKEIENNPAHVINLFLKEINNCYKILRLSKFQLFIEKTK